MFKERPNICTTLAARLANEVRLNVGKPQVIRPAIGGQGSGVAAPIVAAEDHDARHPGLPHLAERDFFRHAAIQAPLAGAWQIIES